MALSRGKNIPKDAVSLSELEAINYVWDLISDWNRSETWALHYGGGILGAYNVVSSIVINKHFRSKLKLGRYGHFASFVPITVLPCIFTALFHRQIMGNRRRNANYEYGGHFWGQVGYWKKYKLHQLTHQIKWLVVITTNILLMKKKDCPVCHELKSAIIQCGFGIVYPVILAPCSGFMLASQYHTYRLPSLTKNPKELFQLWKKMMRPLTGTLTFFAAIGFLLSSVLTYYEMENNERVQKRLIEIERIYDAEHGN